MPAVDIAPLMNSPLWKSWDEPTRAEAKRLLEDPATSAAERAEMFKLLQPRAAAPVVATTAENRPAGLPAGVPTTEEETLQSPLGWLGRAGGQTPARGPAPTGVPPNLDAELQSQLSPAQKTMGHVATESNIGEMAGTLLAPGPYKPFAAAAGAGIGEGVRQYRQGEPFSPRKMGNEALLSLAPEAAESLVRHGVRQFARNSPGGIIMRGAEAAEEARGVPGRVFQPKLADEISAAFEKVKGTGLEIDTGDITRHLTTLPHGKQGETLNILTNLDREHRTGGRYAQLYQQLLSGQAATSTIGDLQNLRSVLRQRAEELRNGSPEARQLVQDLQGAVDDTIDFGLTSGAMAASTPQIRDTLHTARRDWANRAAADDMSELIENKISSTPNLSDTTFRLSSFFDEIRRGRSEASKSINRSLDLTPGARDRFNTEVSDISKLYQSVEFSLTDVAGISRMPIVAAVRQGIGQVLLTDNGRKWFRDAVIEGRGKLSPNAVAYLVNAGRREEAPAMAQQRPIPPGQESRRAPGGSARSTD